MKFWESRELMVEGLCPKGEGICPEVERSGFGKYDRERNILIG